MAVALVKTEPSERNAEYKLILVFEPHNPPPNAIAGYTCLEFGPSGHVMPSSRYSLPEDSSNFFMRQVSNTSERITSVVGGDTESHFFPGASEFIRVHLPDLPTYLSAMARNK